MRVKRSGDERNQRMTEKDRLEFLLKDAVQGFTEFCGMEAVSLEPGCFVTRVNLEINTFSRTALFTRVLSR